jgi:hypothetical protein
MMFMGTRPFIILFLGLMVSAGTAFCLTGGEIVQLKAAGMSGDVLRALIIHGSRNSSDVERAQAQTFLREMGIVVIP